MITKSISVINLLSGLHIDISLAVWQSRAIKWLASFGKLFSH